MAETRFAASLTAVRKAIGRADARLTALSDISASFRDLESMMSEDRQGSKTDEFKKLAQKKRSPLIIEFWFFLRHNKKWWLLPILIILLLLGLLVLLGGTAVAPFIYPLF